MLGAVTEFAFFYFSIFENQVAEGFKCRHIHVSIRHLRDERTGRELAILFAPRPGEHHLVRGAHPAFRAEAVERERGFGERFRDAGLPLQHDRQEGIRVHALRPGAVGEPAHPERIELDAGGFEQLQHLHRRARAFGLEQRLGAKPAQMSDGFSGRKTRSNEAQARKFAQQLIEPGARLEFGRIGHAIAGETHGVQQRGVVLRPVVG